MNFENKKMKLAQIKAKNEEKRLKKLKERSIRFRQTPGKILWGFSLAVALFCIVFIADTWLNTKYTSFEVKNYSKDKVDVIKGGYVVSSTFYWVFVDEFNSLGVHMHKNEFNQIRNIGGFELGTTPLFNVPVNFRINNYSDNYSYYKLEKNYNYLMVIPLFLLIISIIWLFAQPQKSFQWIMFGNFVIIVVPILFTILIFKIVDYLNNIGLYEFDVSGLNI